MNTFFKDSYTDKIKWVNALCVILLSIATTYFIYFTMININEINNFNKNAKPFKIEKGNEVKEVSFYGIDLRLNNDFGVNYLLNEYNIFITEKKIIDISDSDFVYINKTELVNEYKTLKENNFKFLACFSQRYDNSCLFFKQKNGVTTQEEEYALWFLMSNKQSLPSAKGLIERLKESNNMEMLNELNLNIPKENILTLDRFLSNNSRFIFDKQEIKEFSFISHGFHVLCLILIIFFIRSLYINWNEEDAIFLLLGAILFAILGYGFNPFFN